MPALRYLRRLTSSLALWALSATFPSLRLAPRGRLARARLIGGVARPWHTPPHVLLLCGPILIVGVPLSAWCGRLGSGLCTLAFRAL